MRGKSEIHATKELLQQKQRTRGFVGLLIETSREIAASLDRKG